ncbi:MAG: GNAT family N-acetyltransferase [Chloroflexi bacterium]|nr:GNAT family N-acetyltransferase [Chloroflexota bacterium]
MPTSVLFVRHADVHNPREIIYGRLPRFRLGEAGRKKAEVTAQYLASERIAAFYSSPLLRARETASIIARHHPSVPFYTLSLLSEVKTGYQGESTKRYQERDFSFYLPLKEPDDETIELVFRRMAQALHRIVRRHQGQTVVCVSHADPIIILKTGIAGRDLTIMGIKEPDYPMPASVTRFDFVVPLAGPRITYVDPARRHELKKPEPRAVAGRSGRAFTLRPAVAPDAGAVINTLQVVADEKQHLPHRRIMIPPERLASELGRPEDLTVVAEHASEVVGVLRVRPVSGPATFHRGALTVWLLPDFRADGLGRHLLDYGEEWARTRKLEQLEAEVFVDNERAIGLFDRLAYQREGLIARAHRFEEDKVVSYRDVVRVAKVIAEPPVDTSAIAAPATESAAIPDLGAAEC